MDQRETQHQGFSYLPLDVVITGKLFKMSVAFDEFHPFMTMAVSGHSYKRLTGFKSLPSP
jgi:hypothetical protein